MSIASKLQKVVIIYPNTDNGKSINEGVLAKSKENNITVLESLTYLPTDQDFSAIVTKVKGLNPDAIALGGNYADSALIIKQARQAGVKIPIVGNTGLYSPKLVEIGGAEVDGTLLLVSYLSANPAPRVQNFVTKWKAKYKNEEPNDKHAIGYDVMNVIVDAISRAAAQEKEKLSREGIQVALKATKFNGGVVGEVVSFSDKNNWDRPYVHTVVKNGKFVYAD